MTCLGRRGRVCLDDCCEIVLSKYLQSEVEYSSNVCFDAVFISNDLCSSRYWYLLGLGDGREGGTQSWGSYLGGGVWCKPMWDKNFSKVKF